MCAAVPNQRMQQVTVKRTKTETMAFRSPIRATEKESRGGGGGYVGPSTPTALCPRSSGCCNSVTIAGASDVQSTRMGQFTQLPGGVTKNHRPVYQNAANEYLYYWVTDTYQAWHVGPDYNSNIAGRASKANERTVCPVNATAPWRAWYSNQWNDRGAITADCGMFTARGPKGHRGMWCVCSCGFLKRLRSGPATCSRKYPPAHPLGLYDNSRPASIIWGGGCSSAGGGGGSIEPSGKRAQLTSGHCFVEKRQW